MHSHNRCVFNAYSMQITVLEIHYIMVINTKTLALAGVATLVEHQKVTDLISH